MSHLGRRGRQRHPCSRPSVANVSSHIVHGIDPPEQNAPHWEYCSADDGEKHRPHIEVAVRLLLQEIGLLWKKLRLSNGRRQRNVNTLMCLNWTNRTSFRMFRKQSEYRRRMPATWAEVSEANGYLGCTCANQVDRACARAVPAGRWSRWRWPWCTMLQSRI